MTATRGCERIQAASNLLIDIVTAFGKRCRFTGHVRGFYSVAERSLLVASPAPKRLRLEALLHAAA